MTILYDRSRTEISRGTLVELALALTAYRNDIVVAGGWAPYFLTLGHFDHCGSVDIDLVLRPAVIVRYESIRQIVVDGLGYVPTESKFRFAKQFADQTGSAFRLELDLLTEPESAQKAGLVEVQKGLDAALIEGCSIVFDFNYEQQVSGQLPRGVEGSEMIRVADIVGSLTMKGLALGRPAKLEKDSYDVYAVAGYHKGSPVEAAREFSRLASAKRNGGLPENTVRALDRIYRGFESSSSYAAQAVSRFMGYDVSVDAQERIKAFRSDVRP